MVDFLNQQVNPPEQWQVFEKLCADLWGRIWDDPNTQLHGRSGQAQQGVDVYGYKGGDGDLCGVQCKGKDGRYGEAVTETELRKEVKEAKKFYPPLKEFILTTTAKHDAKIQKVARKITKEHKKEGAFRVEVLGWSEIHRRLAGHDDLIDKYYPDQGPGSQRIEKTIGEIREQQLFDEASRNKNVHNVVKETIETLLSSYGLLQQLEEGLTQSSDDPINAEIDGYRDLILKNKPKTAIDLLEQLKKRCWNKATDIVKFRILTNISASYLKLGNKSTASKGFIEARSYEPKNEKAVCNTAMAYLLVDKNDKAKEIAQQATDMFPDSERAYSLIIATSIKDHGVINPESLVPKSLLETGEVVYTISHFYRERGNFEEAVKWISKAYALDNNNIEVRSSYAATLLESVIRDPSTIIGIRSNEQTSALKEAAEVFHGIWNEVRLSEAASQYLFCAINLTTTERILGHNDVALNIIDDALRIAPDSFDLKQKKAMVFLDINKPHEAYNVLSPHPDEEKHKDVLLYVEILSQIEKWEEALEQIETFLGTETDEQQRCFATGLRLNLILKVQGTKEAIEAINEALSNYQNSIFVRVHAATLLINCGHIKEAREQIKKAKSLIRPQTEFQEKLMVADATYQIADYHEASTLYKELICFYNNSQPLRRLLISLYESDQRRELLDLLGKIPGSVRSLSFFRRMAAAIYIRIGKLDVARKEMDEYLSLEPNDLHIHINRIDVLLRQGETDAIRSFLEKTTDFPDASASDRMHLARFFDHFGYPEKAINLAYQARIENPGDPKIHLGYIGLFLMGNVSSALKKPDIIDIGTAFTIEGGGGDHSTYFVLETAVENPLKGEIQSNHPVATVAIGKKAGDVITIEKNPYQTEECRIIEIYNKFDHLFRITNSEFSDRFPTQQGYISVSFKNPDEKDYCFDLISKSAADRQNKIHEVMSMYNTQPYPIGVISKLLGTHPIDVWRGMQADQSIQIYCCDGTALERKQAMPLVNEEDRKFVVDPLTLFNIFTLELQDVVRATVGELGVTQSCLDLLQSFVDDLQLRGKKDGYAYLSKRGDQYIGHTFTKNYIETEIQGIERIIKWVSDNCSVLPAVGTAESPLLAQPLVESMDSAFSDPILAANGSDRLLLSDDQRLRYYAKQLWSVDGVWLQCILLAAVDRNLLTLDQYCEATTSLIERGIYFSTINHGVLLYLAENNEWVVTDRFKTVASTLGSKNADLNSSLSVVQKFLFSIWHKIIPTSKQEKLTYAIINAITNNYCNPNSQDLLKSLLLIGRNFSQTGQLDYWDTIHEWCKGHFVPTPFRTPKAGKSHKH